MVGVVADKANFFAVGREGKSGGIAPSGCGKFSGGHVGVSVLGNIIHQHMAVAAIGIVAPMAIEQFVGNVSLHRSFGFLLPAFGIGFAIGA